MKKIPLKNSRLETLVDAEDFDLLSENQWSLSADGYVYRYECYFGKTFTVYMHRVILNVPRGVRVDHRNFDTLNNQKRNLRACSASQNGANSRGWRRRISRFKGVIWDKIRKKWQARITVNRRMIFLGRFEKERVAATAYNQAAARYFRDFALFNE